MLPSKIPLTRRERAALIHLLKNSALNAGLAETEEAALIAKLQATDLP